MSPTTQALIAVFCVSLISLVGVFVLSINQKFLKKTLLYFVSFAVGALFANVFFHLLPETIEATTDLHFSLSLVLVGILLSFIVEKFIHWHHCHNVECEDIHPVGTLMLVGDGVHNILDGILIATTFMVNTELGIATTIAIMLHEIPQEMSDFAVMLHSGWKRSTALLANFGSALTAFLGAGLVIFLSEYFEGLVMILLPITAGNFLYIAGSDLIPELHKETQLRKAALQLLAVLAGIFLIYSLTPEHAHEEDGMMHQELHDDDHPHTDEEILLELQEAGL